MAPNQTSAQYLLWVVDVETKFSCPLLCFLIALVFFVSVLIVPSSVFPFFYTDKWFFSPNSHTFSPVFFFFLIFFLFLLRNVISRLEVLPIFIY